MRGREDRIAGIFGVFLTYVLLTLIMTYPVVTRLGTHLVGNGDDMWVHFWNNWWVKRVLQQGGEVFYTRLLFHPTGTSLLFHNFAWVNIALSMALEPALGSVAAYNLVFLLHIPLCGLGMFLLVRHLTASRVAALLSGIVYAFLPYRMLHTNHPNIISTEGFPLLMLALLKLVEGKRPVRQGVLCGLLIAYIGYTRWQFLVLAGLMTGAYLGHSLLFERESWCRNRGTGVLLMVIVAGMLVSPALWPLIEEELRAGLPEEVDIANFESGKQDILTYVIPQYQHPFRRLYDLAFPSYAKADVRTRYSAFLGHVAAALAVLGAVRFWSQIRTRFWVGLAIACFALALGPRLWFYQEQTEIPLPYQLIGWLRPIELLGPPRRFNILLGVPFAVLTGNGIVALQERLAQMRWGNRVAQPVVFCGLLGALILLDYWSVPTSTVLAHVPDFYSSLRAESGDFAVLGLPGTRKDAEYYMFYQTVHQRPIASGHVSRLPLQALEFMSSVPLIDALYESGDIDTSLPDLSHQLSSLSAVGFRYIVAHKPSVSPERLADWKRYLVASPRYEDEEVVVFSTSPIAGQDFSLLYELTPGVGLVGAALSTDTVHPEATLALGTVWGTTAVPGTVYDLEIALVDWRRGKEQSEVFPISPGWPTDAWSANALVHDEYALEIEPWLNAGEHSVTARLLRAENGQPVGQEVKIGQVVMQIPVSERVFSKPSMDREVGASFGESLRLLGYDLSIEDESLCVTLHWKALRRMDKSYKIFVHLYGIDDEQPVAQTDFIPYDWGYPTTWWEANEVVSDSVRVPLEDVPPGRYRLAVGAYDAQSGKRLQVYGEGFVVSSGALILREVEVP